MCIRDSACFEPQRLVRKRSDDHTFSANTEGTGLGKEGDTHLLGNQVNRFVCRHDVMRVLGMDGLTLRQLHDRIISKWINLFCKQNPVVLCQVLQHQRFFVSRQEVALVMKEMRITAASTSDWSANIT